jgi:acyl dehydratase
VTEFFRLIFKEDVMENEDQLQESLRALIGTSGTPQVARDPVNQPAIRNWCDAMGMDNPRYTGNGDIVAPAAMLCTWTMPGSISLPEDTACPRAKAFALLREQGFTGIIGTTYEEEHLRLLRPGELLTGTLTLTAVSERKKTGLGEGYFLTTRTDFTNQKGEPVGIWTFRILVFQPKPRPEGAGQKPPAASAPPAPPEQPAAAASLPAPVRNQNTRRLDEIQVGEELPPWSIQITPLLVIACAAATRDYTDIHIDAAAAKRAGARNIILNAMTSNGLSSRYAEDWAGPDVVQKNARLRIGTPCAVGDCLNFSATVAAKEARGASGLVTLNVVGRVGSGEHITGTLDLELPA